MNTAGYCQIIRLFNSGTFSFKTATGVLRSLWAEIAGNQDQYVNKMSFDMSKNIFLKKSLNDHGITVILTPANGECILCKYSH
jgi:hypothetical protein